LVRRGSLGAGGAASTSPQARAKCEAALDYLLGEDGTGAVHAGHSLLILLDLAEVVVQPFEAVFPVPAVLTDPL